MPQRPALPALRRLTRDAARLVARTDIPRWHKRADNRAAAQAAVRDCLVALETAMDHARLALRALDNDGGPDIARNYSACERLRQSITKARSDALALLSYLQIAP